MEVSEPAGKDITEIKSDPVELMLERLSIHWGQSKEWIRQNLSYQELEEKMNYFAIEPFGYVADAIRHAELMSLTANMAGNKTKPIDFMPSHLKPQKQKLTEEMLDKLFG